jgi:ubiquinol-cytochrome c reductase cytochrome b subunit
MSLQYHITDSPQIRGMIKIAEIISYVSMLILTFRSHLQYHLCTYIITYLWNQGFLLFHKYILQLVTGIFITYHYTTNTILSYNSVICICRDIYYGIQLYYMHSNGVSLVYLLSFYHVSRGLYVSSYLYGNILWLSGVYLLLILMTITFLGYVLTWGYMSFWGGTVITNLFSTIPCNIAWMCGGFYVSNPTLKRFFSIHYFISYNLNGFVISHLYHLHYISNSNPLGYNINNFITFYPYILYKDVYSLLIIGLGYTLSLFLTLLYGSHPDNSLEVKGLSTPLHIVPEWYFLHLYMVLKAIPNKTSGLMLFILLSLVLDIYLEVMNLSTNSILTSYNWLSGNILITYFACLTIC